MTYIGHYHVLGCGKRGPRSKCDHRLYFKGISIMNHFKFMIFFFFWVKNSQCYVTILINFLHKFTGSRLGCLC